MKKTTVNRKGKEVLIFLMINKPFNHPKLLNDEISAENQVASQRIKSKLIAYLIMMLPQTTVSVAIHPDSEVAIHLF